MRLPIALSLAAVAAAATANTNYDSYQSKFEKAVNLPKCDSSKSTVKIIDSVDDWRSINDPNLRVFCVKPGDYTKAGKILIKADGTASQQRVIRAFEDSRAPWELPKSKQALLPAITFSGADHWLMDGLTMSDPTNKIDLPFVRVNNLSKNVMLNNMLLENNNDHMVVLKPGSHDFTLQNSVVRTTTGGPKEKTSSCIYVWTDDSSGGLKNPHFVNNEIYNCTEDGIQINSDSKNAGGGPGITGMVIENNDFYITPDLYEDGKGKFVRSGKLACAENAIDIKIQTRVKKPSGEEVGRVIHNRMWGFRGTSDGKQLTSVCKNNESMYAPAVTMHHQPADYILIKDNIIFDSENGVMLAKSGPDNISLIGNIFYDVANKTNVAGAIHLTRVKNTEIYHNTVSKAKTCIAFDSGVSGLDVRNNLCLRAGKVKAIGSATPSKITIGNNYYYETKAYTGHGSIGKDVVSKQVPSGQFSEFCFDRKLRTNPSKFCIPELRPSSDVAYLGLDDATSGQVKGLGIDDQMIARRDIWDSLSAPKKLLVNIR